MVLREASISTVVPPLGHVKHTKGRGGHESHRRFSYGSLVSSAPAGVLNATDTLENLAECGPEQRSMAQKNCVRRFRERAC